MTLVTPAVPAAIAAQTAAPAAFPPAAPRAPQARRSRRDPAVDLVRAACLIAVVTVHALMVGVSVVGGEPVLENALESWGGFAVFSWFAQMMPLFFVLGGFASATHLRRLRDRGMGAGDYVALRLRRLLPVPCAAAIAVVVALTGLSLAGMSPELVATAGWRISQPLWFLGVYVLCTAFVPLALRTHERAPRTVLSVLGGAILLVDAARGVTGIEALGFANLLFVWLFVQQLGFWLADGRVPGLKHAGWAVAGIVALMLSGASPVNLFEALNPPTAALALLGVVQLAAFGALRPRLRKVAAIPLTQRVSSSINGAAMTIYSWHMPVVVLLAGAVLVLDPMLAGGQHAGVVAGSGGALLPVPLTAEWWISRPIWLLAAGIAVAGVVAVAARLERRDGSPAGSSSPHLGGVRVTLAVLSGAGGVLLILAATGALWAWALGTLLLAAATRLATPRAASSAHTAAHRDTDPTVAR